MIADIALIFHWPLSELEALELDELFAWHSRAIDRFKIILQTRAATTP